jgi:putative membrane protein
MLWAKAIHIIFVIAWFAGLFYLPRLFVYHATTSDAVGDQRFRQMERRLFVMMTIGGVGSVASGLWLASNWWHPFPVWLQAKLALVAALLAFHGLCWLHLRAFAAGRNRRSASYYRAFNEVPTLVLIGAVLLVVLKPW